MALDVQQEQRGAVHVLVLNGRLDTETSADLELSIGDLLGSGVRHFVVDLAGISYVSSAGLRVLLATAKQLDGGKGSIRLCALSPAVSQVFDVAGFSKLFAIYPTRTAALAGHPQAKPDAQLAKDVAQLIGAGAPSASANPQAPEIARAAAQLLGAKPAAGATPESNKPKAPIATPLPPKRTAAPAPVAPPKKDGGGLMAKLRGLFGRSR